MQDIYMYTVPVNFIQEAEKDRDEVGYIHCPVATQHVTQLVLRNTDLRKQNRKIQTKK